MIWYENGTEKKIHTKMHGGISIDVDNFRMKNVIALELFVPMASTNISPFAINVLQYAVY